MSEMPKIHFIEEGQPNGICGRKALRSSKYLSDVTCSYCTRLIADNKELNEREEFKEVWKEVEGYNEFYEVSSLGRVRVKRRQRNSVNGVIWREMKVLKPKIGTRGYFQVNLYVNGKGRLFYIHTLVARAFVPNPNGYPEVNHLDAGRLNNKASNLEWCTHKQNMEHAVRLGRVKGAKERKRRERAEQFLLNQQKQTNG